MKEKDKIPGTLQGQAWKRAIENKKPNAGTPHDWEDFENMNDKNKNETSSKGKWHGGKGSIQKDHNHNKFADNWDKIFGKNKQLSEREIVLMDPLAASQRSDNKKKDKKE